MQNAECTTKNKENIPHLSGIKEPKIAALVGIGRAGTKFLQSYLDGSEDILMIPGYPLMYLYPHFDDWLKGQPHDISWGRIIDLFCEKHASVLDSRKVYGLSGLERLGAERDEHIKIDEEAFRRYLKVILYGIPIERRSFLLAIHYAYALCKQWDLTSKKVLLYHIHDAHFLPELMKDFPNLKLICMVRNPRSSLHSMLRIFDIVNQAKLNPTDNLRVFGRSLRFASLYQFNTFNRLKGYLDRIDVKAVKLEGLRDLERTMRSLAYWLGVNFTGGMLESTFDGKSWWGDVAAVRPINKFDADVVSDKWKESLNKFNSFVIEGISFNFFEKYKYDRIAYKRDTFVNRLLLIAAVLVPTKAEWRTVKFYLHPCTHIRFIRAAYGEAAGRIERKDYTWNATYLYKWTYKDLRLWRRRWHERFLESSRSYGALGAVSGCMLYVVVQYARFWASILIFPVEIFRRWSIYYRSLFRRIRNNTFFPEAIN